MPVDLYLGGPEHTVGHLLYSRFWQKILHDEGLIKHDEPFKKLVHQGMVLGEDGEKMSKSRGNVINPDAVIDNYGTDAVRTYVMFMGPLERDKPWSQNGLVGVFKFLGKVWRLVHSNDEKKLIVDDSIPSPELLRITHATIKKITHDIENLSFNTAVSQLMIFVNEVSKSSTRPRAIIKPFLQCLAPFAPHIAEEIWEKMGENNLIASAPWPSFDETLTKSEKVTLALQINGKTRDTIECEQDAVQDTVLAQAKNLPPVVKLLTEGQSIHKIIFVKNRILNLIIK